MIFKIDVDGVLRDMLSVMIRLYNEEFNVSLDAECVIDYNIRISFPLFEDNGIDPYWYFFDEHADDVLLNAPIFDGVREAMEAIHKEHTIIIVTHQPSLQAKAMTLRWLDMHHIPYDSICFTNEADKTSIHCDAIIDDCAKHLDAESGDVLKICIDYAYNRAKSYTIRLKSLKNIVGMLWMFRETQC